MSWRAVTKRTVLDPYRSRYLWIALGIFGLLFGISVYFQVQREVTLGKMLVFMVYVFVPLVTIARSYGTIAGRRQNGSLRVMLSYPNSRRDVVFGTFFGRSVLLAITVSFGFVVASTVYLVYSGVPAIEPLVREWLAALLLGVTMTGVTVGISAGSRTTNRAVLLSFASFLLFYGFWRMIPRVVRYALNGGTWPAPMSPTPEWVTLFNWLNPVQAYFAVVSELVPVRTKGIEGFYASEWFGVLVLLVWLVVPLLVGLLSFERSDL